MKNLLISEREKKMNEPAKLNETELRHMIDSYGNDILRLCTLYLKDSQLAEDATQETFIKVWQKYDTYKGQADEKTWITRIAINICKNYLRTTWFKRMHPTDVFDIVVSNEKQYKQIDESVDLINAILELKDKYRGVLLLYYYQEFSVKEISDILGMKQSTVLSLLSRGRNQLKQKLNTDYMEGEVYEF
ncbi:MAG: RNA polymerase sigma factor [Eubacterium sp.]